MSTKMESLTLKQLQARCVAAGLKKSGNKPSLIKRLEGLEFISANNTVNADLLKRVNDLEKTLAQLQSQNNSDDDDDIPDTSRPNTDGFIPQMRSSPHDIRNTTTRSVVVNTTQPSPQLVSIADHTSTMLCTSAQPIYSAPYEPHYSATLPNYVNRHVQPINVPRGVIIPPLSNYCPPIMTSNVPIMHSFTQTQPPTMVSNPVVPIMTMSQPTTYAQAGIPSIGVKDIVSVLPDFNPMSDGSLTSSQFVHRVQILKDAYQWRDDVLIFAVQQKLQGHAKLWMDAQRDVFISWQQFVQRFTQAFPFDENPATAHIKMANIKRESNETPQAYYYKMLSIGTKYSLTETEIARHIINGINEADLKKKISNDYVTCSMLLHDIETYCRFNEIKCPYAKSKPYVPQTVNKQPYVQNTSPKPVKCYNCNKPGHMSINCPEPQKFPRCGNCNKTSHKTNECPNVKTKSHVNKVDISTPHTQDIIKQISVNGRELLALIDSGSERTLIRESQANELGEVKSSNVELFGFGGGQVECVSKLPAKIEIDGLTYEIDVLIVNDELLSEAVLLGRDVLCCEGQRVVIANTDCWIENAQNVANEASHLKPDEQTQLGNIICANRSVFAENIFELGTCNLQKMRIELTTERVINCKPYRIAFAKREMVRSIIDDLLKSGIIRKSDSPYASPVVLVPKKNNEVRLCVDYRQLNNITVKIPFPLPIIEEQFAQLSGNKFFTALDLRMGYHQVEIDENSKKYTAFVTLDGHYEYNKMPFGLANAPAVFQSIMNTIASKMQPGEILTYLDDVIIPSATVEEGLTRLTALLKVLSEVGLTLRMDKCKFLAIELSYLGHEINADGYTPGEQKLTAVRNFKTPTTVTEVRRFLGLTGFFRKFIQDYAIISKPLTMLLHKDMVDKFNWGDPQQKSFTKLIETLCDKPVLTLYNFHAQHEVHTDASSIGLAGVLVQSDDGKQWRPVFYYSRHCTNTESRYHAYELEVLAAVETITRFRVYLLGKPFKLITDCSAIAKARTNKELIPKIARWYMKLLEYDFEAIHRPASRLAHVDALSRAPVEPACEPESAKFVRKITTITNDWLLTMQLQDETLSNIVAVLKGEQNSDQSTQIKREYTLKSNRLYRNDDGLKFVVPKSVRWRIVQSCHDDVGHFGLDKTIERIRKNFWFPKIRKYVKDYLAACTECCYNKAKGGREEGRLHYSEIDPIPFATLHIDHLGPFIKSCRGMCYVLAISDAFSKYLVVKPVRSTKSSPVISALNELTSHFGLPKRIISDRGTAFTSKLFNDYCDQNDIQHVKVAVRTPRANGQVERANQLILSYLRTTTTKPKNWDLQLHELQWSINTQRNATSGFTPNELVFDFHPRNLTQNRIIAAIHDDQCDEPEMPIDEKRKLAAERIMKERARWKAHFDKRHQMPTTYATDDLVVVAHEPPATGESRKLAPKYRGPYIVTKVLGNDRYAIADIPGMQITQKAYDAVYSSDRLKRWCSASPELDASDDDDNDEDDPNVM